MHTLISIRALTTNYNFTSTLIYNFPVGGNLFLSHIPSVSEQTFESRDRIPERLMNSMRRSKQEVLVLRPEDEAGRPDNKPDILSLCQKARQLKIVRIQL